MSVSVTDAGDDLSADHGLGEDRLFGVSTVEANAAGVHRGRRWAARAVVMAADAVRASTAGWSQLDQRGNPSSLIVYTKGKPVDSAVADYLRHCRRQRGLVGEADTRTAVGENVVSLRGERSAVLRCHPTEEAPESVVMRLRLGGLTVAEIWVSRTPPDGAFVQADLLTLRSIHSFIQFAMEDLPYEDPRHTTFDRLVRMGLTRREAEVAQSVATGSPNAEIADTLMVSVATVKTHLHRIFSKLDVKTRTELALLVNSTSNPA